MFIDHDDELSEMDQAIVGTVCRIEIPMRSASALLQVADLPYSQVGESGLLDLGCHTCAPPGVCVI